MSTLKDINVLLGVTGGIAAYKSTELIRRLKDLGAQVQVVMTPAAEAFITPLTLQALSGNIVRNSLLDPAAEAGMGHIELARWADIIVIAPASADVLARCVNGLANDLLTTVCLASSCPIAFAPAMNQAMWHNPVTQSNIQKVAQYPHFKIWGPGSGSQACGDVGLGRMLEPVELVSHIEQAIKEQSAQSLLTQSTSTQSPPAQPQVEECKTKPATADCIEPILAGKTVVITAGPTREAIDPVRYISNESSGKMGYALAEQAQKAGATVHLISGPTKLTPPDHIHFYSILTAAEMAEASLKLAPDADFFIGAAAVADFRPCQTADQKIKKGKEQTMTIELTKNPDIIAQVAALENRPTVIGFAAETQNVRQYAQKKLQSKNLDMIVANDVSDNTIGFNSDHNAVTIFTANSEHPIPKASKTHIAQNILIEAVAYTNVCS